jgi:hypothetical protein
MKKSLTSQPKLAAILPKEQELKYLAPCVELLCDQTETSCETKIDSFV